MRTLTLLSLCTSLSLFAGCADSTESTTDAGSDTQTIAAVNTHCPIMGNEVKSDGGSTMWNDKKIGFCCEACLPKWDALSDEEKATKLTAADSAEGGEHKDHGDHGDHGSSEDTQS